MTKVTDATVHYTATFPDQDYSWETLVRDHKARGFRTGGYHWYIRRDGTLIEGRPEGTMGAGVRGFNGPNVIHIAWEGGLERATGPDVGVWNITAEQEATLIELLQNIQKRHPKCKRITGHIDNGPSQCPGLTKGGVAGWWAAVGGKQRSIAESRTVVGGVTAGVSTAGAIVSEQASELLPLVGMSDTIKTVFLVLTLAGIGLALYARIDDWNKGKR